MSATVKRRASGPPIAVVFLSVLVAFMFMAIFAMKAYGQEGSQQGSTTTSIEAPMKRLQALKATAAAPVPVTDQLLWTKVSASLKANGDTWSSARRMQPGQTKVICGTKVTVARGDTYWGLCKRILSAPTAARVTEAAPTPATAPAAKPVPARTATPVTQTAASPEAAPAQRAPEPRAEQAAATSAATPSINWVKLLAAGGLFMIGLIGAIVFWPKRSKSAHDLHPLKLSSGEVTPPTKPSEAIGGASGTRTVLTDPRPAQAA